MNVTQYKKEFNKKHYERFGIYLPIGYKEKIKTAAKKLDLSVNEYIFKLICNDLNGVGCTLSGQKESFGDAERELLRKLQVGRKYQDMIEGLSFTKESGYHAYLKEGYVNDVSGSRHVYAKTTRNFRLAINKSHRIGEEIIRAVKEEKPICDWLTDGEIRRLEKWQVPMKYYPAISHVEALEGSYLIVLTDGYINDHAGTNKLEFKSVVELRKLLKYTHKI